MKELKKLSKPLLRVVKESDLKACQPIDQTPIYDWAEKHVKLRGSYAIQGEFSVGKSTFIKPVLDAYKDHSVREICVVASTQGGKSLCMDISLMWSIGNRPGASMWIMQSNQVAEEHATSRLIPTMKDSDAIQDYLPSYRQIAKDCIQFPHMVLYAHGPGERRLQSKSIMNIFGSELWMWPAGTLDWAKKRTKHFYKYGMSKVFVESQGGMEDSDLHNCFKKGTMEVWNVPCPHCKTYFVPDIAHMNCEGKKWNDPELKIKNDRGEYDYGLLEEILTMQCPSCNKFFKDSEQIKTIWAEEGKYIQTNPSPLKGHRSFTWNSFACDPWFDIVYEFIESTKQFQKGVTANLLNFFQQRLARNVTLESMYVQNRFVPTSDYNPKSPFDEHDLGGIFLTVDVQENKYVGIVRAWSKGGNSKLLWFGEMYSADEIEEKRKEWNILPVCVAMDSGGQRTRETYHICAEKGYLAIKGVADKKGFKKPYKDNKGTTKHSWHFWKRSDEAGDPAMGTPQQGKVKKAQLFLFCVNPLKDILYRLRDCKSNIKWECLDKTQWNMDEYNRQLHSEYKKKIINKYGGIEEFWVKIKNDVPNDYADIETYQIGLALMNPNIDLRESFRAPSAVKDNEDEAEDTVGE